MTALRELRLTSAWSVQVAFSVVKITIMMMMVMTTGAIIKILIVIPVIVIEIGLINVSSKNIAENPLLI